MNPRYVAVLPNIPFKKETYGRFKKAFHRVVKYRGKSYPTIPYMPKLGFDVLCIYNHGHSGDINIEKASNYKKIVILNKDRTGIKNAISKGSSPILELSERLSISTYENISEAIKNEGFPLIAKPRRGGMSIGLIKLEKKSDKNKLKDKEYIFQQYIPFKERACEYRIIVGGNEIINASKRIYKDELIEEGHRKPWEWKSLGKTPSLPSRLIEDTYSVKDKLNLDVVAVDWLSVKKRKVNSKYPRKYLFLEANTGFGIGDYTMDRLYDRITEMFQEVLSSRKIKNCHKVGVRM